MDVRRKYQDVWVALDEGAYNDDGWGAQWKLWLETNKIETCIKRRDQFSTNWLYVRFGDLERAKKLLDEYEALPSNIKIMLLTDMKTKNQPEHKKEK